MRVIQLSTVQPDVLFAWRGMSLLITDTRGECGREHPLTGYYFRETRFLSRLALEIEGADPWLCDAAIIDPRTLAFTFIHPESGHYGIAAAAASEKRGDPEKTLPDRALDLRLTYAVRPHRLEVAAVISNRSDHVLHVSPGWRIGVDFRGFLEAFQAEDVVHGDVRTAVEQRGVTFRYSHPKLPFHSTIRGSGAGEWTLSPDRVTTRLRLEPQQATTFELWVDPHDPEEPIDDESAARREQVLSAWAERATDIVVPGDAVVGRIVTRAVEDLGALPLLQGDEGEWLAPQAGLPRFPAFFARDGLTTGWQTAMVDRAAMLEATFKVCDRLQATAVDDFRDAEPGRILYQLRHSPKLRLGMTPEGLSYADFASSLMYVMSLANLYAWSGDRRVLDSHWDTARRVLEWAQSYGDRDGDGYLEYKTKSPKGPRHQGWKDSERAVVYEDGREVEPPIATCELQAYWFAALQMMAILAALRGEAGDAQDFWSRAAALKKRFNRDWWVESDGLFGLALDPTKRLVTTATSNVGHCLTAGIIDLDRLPRVVGRLFAPDMFSGWGVRTMSSAHPAYNPVSYHLGSVWAVENATIAFGLRRYGFDARMLDIAGALFQLAERYPAFRVPECIGGYPRDEHHTPGAFPIADPLQAWNTSVYPLLIQSLLGLQPVAPIETLFVDPGLPSWLPEVILRGLRVGEAAITLRFIREEDGNTTFEVLHKTGTLRVIRQPPPESRTATLADRMNGVLESVLPTWVTRAL